MQSLARLTIFADDPDDKPSQDYLWVQSWLERWGDKVRVADYSSGGWEHLWDIEGHADAIAEVPPHLHCVSDWAGLPNPEEPLNLDREGAQRMAGHWLWRQGLPGDDSTWQMDDAGTLESHTHFRVSFDQTPTPDGTMPFPELPARFTCEVSKATGVVELKKGFDGT